MIISNLRYSDRVEGMHPLFKRLFDYVKSHNLLEAEIGKIVLDGDELFINNVELEGVSKSDQVLEMHRSYIDVHILLKGEETIGWKSIDRIKNYTQHYEEEGDCAISDDKPELYTTLYPGDFMIVYPEDLHAPAIGEGKIRKLIAKVRL